MLEHGRGEIDIVRTQHRAEKEKEKKIYCREVMATLQDIIIGIERR